MCYNDFDATLVAGLVGLFIRAAPVKQLQLIRAASTHTLLWAWRYGPPSLEHGHVLALRLHKSRNATARHDDRVFH